MTACFLVRLHSLGDRTQEKLRGRENPGNCDKNISMEVYIQMGRIVRNIFLLLLSFIRKMHSYELFTFRDICEKTIYKGYIHKTIYS